MNIESSLMTQLGKLDGEVTIHTVRVENVSSLLNSLTGLIITSKTDSKEKRKFIRMGVPKT